MACRMAPSGPLSPLAHRSFTLLWVANLVTALGTWIQSTAASWTMTAMAPEPLMVSLVQAAAQLPVLLLAVPAGALADITDRRRFLVLTNSFMLAVSAVLALVAALGWLGPWGLLALTALLSVGAALNSPAWSATVPMTLPRAELSQGLVLNSMGFNVARAIGPAIGGLLVASLGVAVAFAANAVTFAFVGVVVGLLLALPAQSASGPREHLAGAIRIGLRFARAAPTLRLALARSALFYGSAAALWALLPLHVATELGGGAGAYGLLLGAIGVGAIAGGAVQPLLLARLSRDRLITVSGLLCAAGTLPCALASGMGTTAAGMFVFGLGWMWGASNLQAIVQLLSPPWVRARAVAIYQAIYYGAMGGGAIAWGWVGEHAGLSRTFVAATIAMALLALAGHALRLPDEIDDPTAPLPEDWRRLHVDADPALASVLAYRGGQILVSIRYHVPADRAEAFREAISAVRDVRRRCGARLWGAAQDIVQAENWSEMFVVDDWEEAQRAESRLTLADLQAIRRAQALHVDESPPVWRLWVSRI